MVSGLMQFIMEQQKTNFFKAFDRAFMFLLYCRHHLCNLEVEYGIIVRKLLFSRKKTMH